MPSKLISVIVTLGPSAVKSSQSTLEKLKAAGLQDANFLEFTGIVTGRISEEKMQALRNVPGITVEKDETKHIR